MKRLSGGVLITAVVFGIVLSTSDSEDTNSLPIGASMPCRQDAKQLPSRVGTVTFADGATAVLTTGNLRAVPNSTGSSVRSITDVITLTTFSEGNKTTIRNDSPDIVTVAYGDCVAVLPNGGIFSATGNGTFTISTS